MKEGFVYKWKHIKTGMMYIGCHYGTFDDAYISSSNYFNEYYNSSPLMFKREILVSGLNRQSALDAERKELCRVDAANSAEYYNLHNYSGRGWAHHDNPELAKIYYARISKAKTGQPSKNKGKHIWADKRHKLRIDKWQVITPSGDEIEIENMTVFCKEHNLNPSAMSAVARGNKQHYKKYKCKKLTNNRNVHYEFNEWKSNGKPGKAHYGGDNGFSKKVKIYNKVYYSMKEATVETGLSMYKLRKLGDFDV